MRGESLVPSVYRVYILRREKEVFMGRCQSGQMEQTVNLPASCLRGFESLPAHNENHVRRFVRRVWRSLLKRERDEKGVSGRNAPAQRANPSLPTSPFRIAERENSNHKLQSPNTARGFISLMTDTRWSELAWHNQAVVAQSVEHVLGKDEVTGSIPVNGSR